MTSFEFSDNTLAELHKLKDFYRLETITATVQRALAVASILSELSGEDGSVLIMKPGTDPVETVKFNQRYKHSRV